MAFAVDYIPEELRGIDFGEQANFYTVAGGFTSLNAAQEIVFEHQRNMINRAVQKTGAARGPEPSLLGAMMGRIGFKLPMRGGKDSAGAASESEFSLLAKNMGFTRNAVADGAGKVTGGAVGNVTMLDADAATYIDGGFVCVNRNGTIMLRAITEIASSGGTTTISVTPDFPSAPQSGDDLLPLDVFTPTVGVPAAYLSFDGYLGFGTTYRQKFRFLGCAGTFKLPATQIGEEPLLEFEYMIDNWTPSKANRTQAEDGYAEPSLLLADEFYWGASAIDIESIGFDPGMALAAMPGQLNGNVSHGRIGWFYRDPTPVLEINPYWDDEWLDLWAAKTTEEACYFNVTDSKQFWGFCVHKAQIAGVDQGSIAEGLVAATPSVQACDPHENSEGNTLPQFAFCVSGDGS